MFCTSMYMYKVNVMNYSCYVHSVFVGLSDIFVLYTEAENPVHITVPLDSLNPGQNTISISLTDSDILTGVLTIPGKSCTTFYYLL